MMPTESTRRKTINAAISAHLKLPFTNFCDSRDVVIIAISTLSLEDQRRFVINLNRLLEQVYEAYQHLDDEVMRTLALMSVAPYYYAQAFCITLKLKL